LGRFRLRDATAMARWDEDPEHQRWFGQPVPGADPAVNRGRCEAVIRSWWQAWSDGRILAFAIRESARGPALGAAELRPRAGGLASISYTVLPDHRGRGLASRAARLLATTGLTRFGLTRIELACDAENAASRRVAEKAGFRPAGERRVEVGFDGSGPPSDRRPILLVFVMERDSP
jgi:RimJ/RimL family protein N-acetyltransferase